MTQEAVIEVAIGVLMERRHGGWYVLVARRRHDTVLAGYWELPGGKIEAGESAQQCLVREFQEELGVQVQVEGAWDAINHVYDHGQVHLRPMTCVRLGGEPTNRQVAEHCWADPQTLGRLVFPPANEMLMRDIADELERKQRADSQM